MANGGTVIVGPGVTFTATPSQDLFTGYGDDIFNAPLAGVVGEQSATLQSGDSFVEISPSAAVVMNATFNPTNAGTETFGFFHFFGEIGNCSGDPGGFFVAKTTTIDGPNFVNATIEGIPTWNLTGTGDVYGLGPYVAINGGPNVTGVTTVNVINSSVDTIFEIGGGGANFQPLQDLVTTIGASNDAGGDRHFSSGVNIIQQHSLFTATTAVQVNLANAGVGPPASDTYSQDYVRGIDQTFFIADGPDSGKAGVVIWNIASGGAANYVFLSTDGSTSATTINITGAGALTLFGNGHQYQGEFSNLTTINASTMTGNLTIAGTLNDYNGILNDTPLLSSVMLGSGVNWIDMSGFTLAQLDAMTDIDGGSGVTGNTVVFDNSVLTHLPHGGIPGLTDFTIIGDAGDNGFSSSGGSDAGTINWANLPATANELIFYGDIGYSGGGLNIINTPGIFTVNFQNNDFNDNAITITDASTTSTTDMVTLILGCDLNGSEANGFHSVVTINGYATVNIDAIGVSHFATGGENSFVGFDLDANPGSAVHVNISGMASFDFGTSYFTNAGGKSFSENTANAIATVGSPSVSVGPNGAITDTDTGGLTIASTDAALIDAHLGGGLSMTAPDTNVEGVTVLGSNVSGGFGFEFSAPGSPGNILQGSLGILASGDPNMGGGKIGDGAPIDDKAMAKDIQYDNPLSNGNTKSDVYTGAGGTDSITGGSDGLGDWIFTTGGGIGAGAATSNPNPTSIVLNNAGGDQIFYSQFADGPVASGGFISDTSLFAAPLAITDSNDVQVGGGTASVTGFTGGDVIDFAIADFGFKGKELLSGDKVAGLVEGDGKSIEGIANGMDAIFFNDGSAGVTLNPTSNFLVYDFNGVTYANAAQLGAAVISSQNFLFDDAGKLAGKSSVDVLIAYHATGGGVNIAELSIDDLTATKGGNSNTEGATIVNAIDLVHLAGLADVSALASHNIHFL